MRMRIAAAIAAIGVGLAGTAVGMDSQPTSTDKMAEIADPIPARQELMKMNGAAMGAASKMVKGEMPFNATEAADAMNIIARNMEEFPSLFPADSMIEGKTRATTAVWENMDGFKAEADSSAAAAKAAAEAAGQGLDAFKVAFGPVGQACGSCHETYRGPKLN